MALTGAKPFLKNISKEIHSKALADNTDNIKLEDIAKHVWQEHILQVQASWQESVVSSVPSKTFVPPLPTESHDEEGNEEPAPRPPLAIVCASQN